MSLSEYVLYENDIRNPESLRGFLRGTTKDEWTERFEFIYRRSKEYIALSKIVSDAYTKYNIYKNKHLYTDDKDTTCAMQSQLYSVYNKLTYKRFSLKFAVGKAFKERFPSIKNPSYEVEHYLYCCELHASHRLKGIEYNLPFPVETDSPPPAPINDFPVGVDESNPSDNNEPPPENKPPPKPVGKWEDLKVVRTKSKPLVIREVKKSAPKKHTLSMLLTQEKEKTRKLQEMLVQTVIQTAAPPRKFETGAPQTLGHTHEECSTSTTTAQNS